MLQIFCLQFRRIFQEVKEKMCEEREGAGMDVNKEPHIGLRVSCLAGTSPNLEENWEK